MTVVFNVSDLPRWRVSILASVLIEYQLVSEVTLGRMAVTGPAEAFKAALPIADAKANLLVPMAKRVLTN